MIGIVVAVAAIVGGAIFILSDSSKKRPAGDQAKDEKTAAAAPTLTAAPQAADAAKGVTPGADVNAQRQWQTLRLDIANQSENDGYQALVARIEEHVRQFPGATTAKEAQEALKGLQAKWKTAADEALAAIDVFLSGREFGKALSDAQALLAWCPKTMQEEIQAKIKEIELKRSTEVAQVPKKSEEETTTPPNEGSGDDDTTTKTPADDEDPEELTASDDAKGKKTGESDEDPEELTPDTTTTKKKDDKGDDLFKKKGTVGPKQDLLAKLIKKEGLEKVQKEVERLFECTKVVVSEDGRVRVGYAFSTREDRLARDWTPAIGKKQSQRIRWSADWEGTIRWVFYGVRISEYGALLNDACFTEQVEVEACYMSAQATSKRTTIVVGVLDKKDNIWLGSNMGAQAIQGDNAGKVTRGNPSVPREFPEVEKTRWFKMVYADKKVTSYLALGGGARDPVTFEVEPTYRKTGEIEVKKGGTKMCPGIAFYPDIVGTIGFVRFSGYLNPEWLREQAKKRGCNLDFDAVGVGDI